MQVAVVRFINPPWTLPMLIDQGGAMFSSGAIRIGVSQHILTGEAAGNEQGHWIYRTLSRFVD
jgi:hypothetical protein